MSAPLLMEYGGVWFNPRMVTRLSRPSAWQVRVGFAGTGDSVVLVRAPDDGWLTTEEVAQAINAFMEGEYG